MEIENYHKLKGLKIRLFTKKDFRVEGIVKEVGSKFLEIHDEVRNTDKFINLDNIGEIEVLTS